MIAVQEERINFMSLYYSPTEMLSKQSGLFLLWKSNADFPGLGLVAAASGYFYSTSKKCGSQQKPFSNPHIVWKILHTI